MSQAKQVERRSFPRRLLDFNIELKGVRPAGTSFDDQGHLITVSGNGAQFHTSRGDAYYLDQLLDVSIVLPGTPDVLGRMETVARVRRVELQDRGRRKNGICVARIAVSFEHPLQLQRRNSPDVAPDGGAR